MRKIKINPKIIISICTAIIIVLIISFGYIIHNQIKSNQYSQNIINLFEKNETPIFNIEEISLTSSVNAIDISQDKNLQNLNLYQYVDIALKVNNGDTNQKLTNKNTVKKLYIDNISFETNSIKGEKSLFYTNSLENRKNEELQDFISNDKIDFNIVRTNHENNNTNYDMPTFYADCSNPITLKYLNKDIVKGYRINKGDAVTFDGKLIKKLGITSEDLECKVKFKINIVNNDDELYTCWVNFSLPIDELLDKGTIIKHASTQGSKYEFYCM